MTATTHPDLKQMQLDVFDCNEANGWFEDDRSIGEDFALIHSEIAEALEAYRSWGIQDATLAQCKKRNVFGDHDENGHLCKPEGVGSELADVVVRILDTVHRRPGLEWWFADKRLDEVPPYVFLDGSFGDHIEQLHILAARRELGALLGGVIHVAKRVGVDLQAEFDRKLAYNRTRGHRHGNKLL